MRVSLRADGVSVGRTSNAGCRMRPVVLLPIGGRPWTTSGIRHPARRSSSEMHTSGSPARTITFRCKVTTLRSLVRGRGGADMGRSPDRPYLRRPRVRPWLIGHWEMWQLRGPVVVAVVLVCGAAALLVGAQIVPLRATGRDVLLTAALVLLGLVHTELATGSSGCAGASPSPRTSTSAPSGPSPPPCCCRRRSPRSSSSRCTATSGCGSGGPAKCPLHRHVYTTAAVVLAARPRTPWSPARAGCPEAATGRAGRDRPGRGGLRRGQQRPLVGVDRAAARGRPRAARAGPPPARQGGRQRTGDRHDLLGALAAVAAVLNAWLVLLVLPPLLVLHRAVHGAPARGAGQHRRQDGPAQRRRLARPGRARPAPRAAPAEPPPACSSSTSTTSRRSTTPTGTSPATRCWPRSPQTLRAEVREGDVVGRFGGEEFVVLLRDLPPTSAGRRSCSRSPSASASGSARARRARCDTPDGPLTSTGCPSRSAARARPAAAPHLEQVLQAADAALYAAKRDGRNLVRIGPPRSPPAPPRLPRRPACAAERADARRPRPTGARARRP